MPLLGTTTRLLPLTPIRSGAASPTRLPAEVSDRSARTLAAGPIGSEKEPSPRARWTKTLPLAVRATRSLRPSPLKSAPPVIRLYADHDPATAERAPNAPAPVPAYMYRPALAVASEHVGRAVAVLVADTDELAVVAHALGEHGPDEATLGGPEQGDHAALVPGHEVVASVLVDVADGGHQGVVLGGLDDLRGRLELAVALARADPEHALLAGGDQVEHAVAGQVGRDQHLGAVGPALGGDDGRLAEGGEATGGQDQSAAVAGAADDEVGIAGAHEVGLRGRVGDLERRSAVGWARPGRPRTA